MALSLDLLRSFLAVYREGSVTGAARRLGVSQPAVTGQVRALEAQVGRPLFVRQPRGVAPTPVADLLARQVAAALDELEAVTAPAAAGVLGTVHLGGACEFLTEVVLPALAPLAGTGVRLRVSLGLSDDLVHGLESGALDLAVLTGRPKRRGLVADPLYDEEFVLVAAPRHDGADLGRVPLVAYAEELPIIRRYWRSVFDTRATRTADVVVPNLHAVLAAVRAGAGYSVLPEYLCRADLAAGRLVALRRPEVPPLNTLFLAHRAAVAPPAVAHVRAMLLAAAKSW